MRTDFVYAKSKLEEIDEIYLDVSKIVHVANKFFNLCVEIQDQNKAILNLFEAKTYFEVCITVLKSIIEQDNLRIEKVNEKHSSLDVLEKYIENFMAILDARQEKLYSSVKQSRDSGGIVTTFTVNISVKSFRETLVDFMNDLVILPLINATKKYRIVSFELEESKRKEAFEYLLFREIVISAKIKGSTTRQKLTLASDSFGSHFHETNITKVGKSRNQQSQELIVPDDVDDFAGVFEAIEGDNPQEEQSG